MGGAYHSGGGKVGFYRRLSYSQPSPTVVTSPVQKATMMCHPTQDRPLSVAEYAVPVGLGRAIGDMLISVANNRHMIVTKRMRGTAIHSKIQDAIRLDCVI